MSENEKPVRIKARADIEAGRLWKARDRLAGVIRFDRYDQIALDLLGEVHFAMGDLPAAGRHWFLTERSGPDVDRAREALEERYGNDPALILESIPLGGELERYPALVRSRIDELVEQAGKRGQRLLKARRRYRGRKRVRTETGDFAGCLVAALFIGVLLLGLVELIQLLGRLLA